MPKKQSTASRRGRQAARRGEKFTTATLPREQAVQAISPESQAWIAETQQRELAEALTAVCSAEPEGPFILRVLDPAGGADLVRLEYDWEDFRASSAGHRLIEHGYTVLPSRHYLSEQVAGWRPAPGKDWTQSESGEYQEWHNLVLPPSR